MTLPGVEIITQDLAAPKGPRLRLSTPLLVGELARGPEAPVLIRSARDLTRYCGPRTLEAVPMHDWVDDYFHEGGGVAYVTPLRGPAAAAAQVVLRDATTATAVAVTVAAKEKGSWGNGATGGLSVAVDAGTSGTFIVRVLLAGVQVETSGELATLTALAVWATGSRQVTVTLGPGGNPVPTAVVNLAGGVDDFAAITTTQIVGALARFARELGPGTFVLPGRTALAAQLAAAAAGAATNRLVKCDLPPTADTATLLAQAAQVRAGPNADLCDILAPRLGIPGLAPSTSRTVPASALRCGCEARNEAQGISPNQPAAGRWGQSQWAGTTPTIEWARNDREDLNNAGVNVVRTVDGDVRLYGARTAADPATAPAALRLGSARLRQAITEIARFEAEQIEFGEIDQGGVELGNLAGRVSGRVNAYQASLYFLDVTAELVADDVQPGVYLVQVEVEFQAAPDAERVRVVIIRAVTEV